jgi:radical SAM superfamily enzyme YgiQ (UPF0313 family)
LARISLIRPVYRTAAFDPEVQEPLGIETLAGVLRSEGHTVQLLDPLLTHQTEAYSARQAAAFGPDWVGLSLMSRGDLASANAILSRIRAAHSHCQVVAGGNLVSTEPEVALEALPPGTVCIRYEGELPWRALLRAAPRDPSAANPLAGIPSALMRQPDRTVVQTPVAPPLEDLDALPFAARDLAPFVLAADCAVNVQGSRGCTGACPYCCAPGFPRGRRRQRMRSAAHIAAELEQLTGTHNVGAINFVDDDFIGAGRGAGQRMYDLASEIRRRGLQVSFGIQARPASLTEEIVALLAGVGLSYVFFGVESDDADVMRAWHRPEVAPQLGRLMRLLRKYDIEAQAGCILFHPDTTLPDIDRLARTLYMHGLLNYRTATNRLVVLPGSEMHRKRAESGELPAETAGPFAPPFRDAGVQWLHAALLRALEPLRPAWVFAASRLPSLNAYARLGRANSPARFGAVQQVLAELDAHIAAVLFRLLAAARGPGLAADELDNLAAASFAAGSAASAALVRGGLIEDAGMLAEAVRKDRSV